MIYSQLWEEWVVLFTSSSQTSPKKKKKPALKEQWKDCGATDRAKAAADQE